MELSVYKFLFFLIIISPKVFAQQTFYIYPSNSTDNFVSTRDQIRAINKNMTGDITVILKRGTHYLDAPFELNKLDGGTNGHKVIWKAEDPGHVFLSGGKVISKWELFDTRRNVYYAKVGNIDFRQIYVNGTRAIRARTPNWNGGLDLGPYFRTKGVDVVAKTLSVNCSEINNWDHINQVELVTYPSWYHNRYRISSFTKNDSIATVSFQSPESGAGFSKPKTYYTNAAYFFENAYELLDAEGEWYLNTVQDILYYKPRAGEDMSNIEVVIPMVETLIYISGNDVSPVTNISFEGIVFEHSTWTLPSTNGLIATQCLQPLPLENETGSMNPVNRPSGAVRVDFGDAISFYNNTFTRLGANGLVFHIGDKNCIIDNNTFEKLSGNGLVIDAFNKINPNANQLCQNFKVTNNIFQKVGLDYTNSTGMLANIVQNLVFENNKISNMPYSGLQVGTQSGGYHEIGLKNISISYNDISNFTLIHNDGGGIYTLGHQPGCLIKDNYIHDWCRTPWDSDKTAPSNGIYLDNFGKYIVVDHNMITGYNPHAVRTNAVFIQKTTSEILFINNETLDQCVIEGAGPGKRNKGCILTCTPPPIPIINSIKGNKLSWKKVAGATGYIVWCSYNGLGRYTEYYDVGDVDSFTCNSTGSEVFYAIQAYNGGTVCRNIGYSNSVSSFNSQNKMEWWKDAKFGMFIHWGLFSKTAGYWKDKPAIGAEHFMLYERIPCKEYAEIAKEFNPVEFDAEKWAVIAKNAGMKYLVITSKHHDGFAMFNSPSSDYNIKVCTPYGKDPMMELVDACHRHGLKFGFYYSLGRDWQDPDVPTNWPVKAGRSNTWDFPNENGKIFNQYFERKVKPQIKELLTQYGSIDILWFDTPELISKAESAELRDLILKLQPNCIINSRIGNNYGDYKVTEQEIIKEIEQQPWEACITMSKNWGYIKTDTVYKSPELMIRQLLEIVSKGGNLLLNNGPTAEGEITINAQLRLQQIGKWMEKNSSGIYGTHPWKIAGELLAKRPMNKVSTTYEETSAIKDAVNDATSKLIIPEVRFTATGNYVFAFVCSWKGNGVLIKSLSLTHLGKIKKIELLDSSKKMNWKQTSDGLIITFPFDLDKEINIIGFKIEI